MSAEGAHNNSGGHPAGHNVAGTFYLIWGLWWLFISYWVYFTQHRSFKQDHKPTKSGLWSTFTYQHDDPFADKSWIPIPLCPSVPLEPIIKVVLPGLGVIVETFFDVHFRSGGHSRLNVFFYKPELHLLADGQWAFSNLSRLYHISLYLAFVVSGAVDLISYYLKLPKKTSQLFLCIAFYIEVLLFSYHIHGRMEFNTTVHKLLLLFVVAGAVFSTLRIFNPRNIFINAGLAGSMILQGTNLIQAGWILYGPRRFSQEGHDNAKFIAAVTTWHLLGTGLFMLAVFVVMQYVHKRTHKFLGENVSVLCEWDEEEKLMNKSVDSDCNEEIVSDPVKIKQTSL